MDGREDVCWGAAGGSRGGGTIGFFGCSGADGGGAGLGAGGGAAGLTILAQDDLGSMVREDDLAVGVEETGAGGGLGVTIAAAPLTGAGCSLT